MKKSIVILYLLFLSCASISAPLHQVDALTNFFQLCESDLDRARQVIVSHDLIKTLGHLQRMDSGGKKYYLLERDTITALIRSVTAGVYTDFILINKDGIVVYTMDNDGLFAKDVRKNLAATAIYECYNNKEISPFITGVSSLSSNSQGHHVAISSKISGGNTMPGIFILIVDIAKIQEILGSAIAVVNTEGKYEISSNHLKINMPYGDFKKIKIVDSNEENTLLHFTNARGRNTAYRFFKYSNLRWILVSE